jgi:hypothetical protein
MIEYELYKQIFDGQVRDSKSPYYPYFSKELKLIEKNVGYIFKKYFLEKITLISPTPLRPMT